MTYAKNLLGYNGDEDNYTKNNTNNTFFKTSFKTYSNFATNWIAITNNNKPNPSNNSSKFPSNSETYFRIPLQGDVLLDSFLRFKLYDNNANNGIKDVNINNTDVGIGEYTALSLIKNIDLLYNDKVISSLDKNFIASYMKLSSNCNSYIKYRKFSSYNNNSTIYDKYMPDNGKYIKYVCLPLPFWYTKSEGLGFPMWALNDPNLGMKITLENYDNNNIYGENTCNIFDIELLAKYGYLDDKEKDMFKNVPLEYNIEQIEITNKVILKNNISFNEKINIPYTHFVKCIIWNITENDKLGYNETKEKFEFDSCKGINNTSLSLNGNMVFSNTSSNITAIVNRHIYFKCPDSNIDINSEIKGKNDLDIHTHSFSINPLDYKLSGFLTTSKFNQCILNIQGTTPTNDDLNNYSVNVYTLKHNIIRFKDGIMDILFN